MKKNTLLIVALAVGGLALFSGKGHAQAARPVVKKKIAKKKAAPTAAQTAALKAKHRAM